MYVRIPHCLLLYRFLLRFRKICQEQVFKCTKNNIFCCRHACYTKKKYLTLHIQTFYMLRGCTAFISYNGVFMLTLPIHVFRSHTWNGNDERFSMHIHPQTLRKYFVKTISECRLAFFGMVQLYFL